MWRPSLPRENPPDPSTKNVATDFMSGEPNIVATEFTSGEPNIVATEFTSGEPPDIKSVATKSSIFNLPSSIFNPPVATERSGVK